MSELVTQDHLKRRAVIYVRQSTMNQVVNNQESLRLQYALQQRARQLGWRESDVEIIDADLGQSGASAARREGFKELVGRVAVGEIGLVLSIDVTRLARNCSDWYPLLDVCGHGSCLIADRDGVYDPGTPNGRLLPGLKGTISEVELHTIRGRLTAGLMAKAARGELAVMLPAGFERRPDGTVVKDANREVRDRIDFVFSSFLQLRSASAVMRLLVKQSLALPRHDRFGDVCWAAATTASVASILKNPAYAGAFVYGRTRMKVVASNSGKPQKMPRPIPEWRIVVRDKYPAYIAWETYTKIRSMLEDNRADYQKTRGRGVPRDGVALLHGITWCGECGRKMRVRYKCGGEYVCNQRHQQNYAPRCQTVYAAPIDDAVVEAFLAAVAPAEIRAWTVARKAQRQADDALNRAHEQQIERLRYEARLAERQYNRVDPDNRLVADELERRWESRLVELRQAETALLENKQSELATIAPRLLAKVVTIGESLPQIWNDPSTAQERRKQLLRCLIDKVVLRRTSPDEMSIRIVWRGGSVSELSVAMLVSNVTKLSRWPEMEARIIELAGDGLTDAAVAAKLTEEGHRSPKRGDVVLPNTVAKIRRSLSIKAAVAGHEIRWPKVEGFLSVESTAARLRVPAEWLRKKLRAGALITHREPSGRYLFPDDDQALEKLAQLRGHQIQRLDLRPNNPNKEGHHYA